MYIKVKSNLCRILAVGITLLNLYAYGAEGRKSPIELLGELRELKTASTAPATHDGWIDENIINISTVASPVTMMRMDTKLEQEVISNIKSAKRIYITSHFLANPKIIQALVYTKRVNSAIVVVILEDKIKVTEYITPDFLTQNGVMVFHPSKAINITGTVMLIDNLAYAFSSLDFGDKSGAYCIKFSEQRAFTESKFYILSILNTAEMSDFTKMRQPNAMRIINADLQK